MSNKNRGLGVMTFVVALIVVVACFVGLNSKIEDTQKAVLENLGGSGGQFYGAPEMVDGVSLGKEDIIKNTKKLSLLAGDNNLGWKNNTGRTVYVSATVVSNTGVASSTMTIDVATSTSQNITDYSDPFSEVIDSFSLATSSPAGTIANSFVDGGTNGTGYVQVADQEWVSLLLSATAGTGCDGSACETATSTNRGFNLDVYLDYFYKR